MQCVNNPPASPHAPVGCSASQERRGKIDTSSFKKAGGTVPHHICEQKGYTSIGKMNVPVMLLSAEDAEHGVACISANELPQPSKGYLEHLSHYAVVESCFPGGAWQAQIREHLFGADVCLPGAECGS